MCVCVFIVYVLLYVQECLPSSFRFIQAGRYAFETAKGTVCHTINIRILVARYSLPFKNHSFDLYLCNVVFLSFLSLSLPLSLSVCFSFWFVFYVAGFCNAHCVSGHILHFENFFNRFSMYFRFFMLI